MIRFLQTPGKFQKALLTSVLVFIAALMVITLIPGGFLGDSFGFGTGTPGVLAQIGSQRVTSQEVDAQADRIRTQRNYPAAVMPYIRQQAAESLITLKAMLAEADRIGLKVTDKELQDELRSGMFGQTFFPNGQFIGEQQYESFVEQQIRMSVPQFEEALKQDLLRRKLSSLVADGVTVSDDDIKGEYVRENTKVKLEYAVLSADDLMKGINPSETELKAYFERNKARYKDSIPEQRKAKYVVVDTARVAEKLPVTQEDLQRYYNEHRDQFRVQDEVNVRHILVKMPPPGPDGKEDPKAVAAAKAKAEDLLKQIKGGADFAALAKKVSDDPGSKDNGGSLGWIQKGRTVKEFEQAAFGLDKGQTSGVVQSSFGFHIIRVDDKRNAHQQTLDEVKAQIEPLVKRQKAQRDAEQLANKIETQGRTSTLEQAAAANGFSVTSTESFKRTDVLPGIGPAPDVMERLFTAGVKSAPAVAPIPQGFVVYQVTDIKPAATPTFEQIKAQVESDFKRERATSVLAQKAQELADRARSEHDLKKAAKESGAAIKTSELVGPSSQVPDIGPLTGRAAAALSMKPGEIGGPVQGTGDNAVVFSVLERQEPSMADIDKSREQVRDTLVQRKRQMVLENFAVSLRERMEKDGRIRWNKEERDRLFNQKPGTTGM